MSEVEAAKLALAAQVASKLMTNAASTTSTLPPDPPLDNNGSHDSNQAGEASDSSGIASSKRTYDEQDTDDQQNLAKRQRTEDPSQVALDPSLLVQPPQQLGYTGPTGPCGDGFIDSEGLYEEILPIAASCVGYVIGRKGENIKHIQATTQVNMQIQKTEDMRPGSGTRDVSFKHRDQAAVKMARDMVVKMVKEREAAIGGGMNGLSQAEKVKQAIGQGQQVATVQIPDADVGLIIGKGGVNIRSIQERTGANVQIPQSADADNHLVRTVTVTHPTIQGCEAAKTIILEMLKKDGPGSATSLAMGSSQGE